MSALLLLFPPLMAVFLSLPVLLLHIPHSMAALPGGSLCIVSQSVEFNTYQSSVAILGFCLPVAIIICLIIGLSIRRCVSCSGGRCISSFCKEEMVLALLTLPYSAAYLAMYLPLLDQNLALLDLPQSGLQEYLTPELARASEMVMALLLPLLLFSTLPCTGSSHKSQTLLTRGGGRGISQPMLRTARGPVLQVLDLIDFMMVDLVCCIKM